MRLPHCARRPIGRIVTRTWPASLLAALAGALATSSAAAQGTPLAGTVPAADGGRYVVEYYYKVRWGHQQEFWELFRRNHLPLLLARVQRGTMAEVTAVAPRYHATEDGRWDYRVTIVFPNVAAALGDSLEAGDRRRLYPDSARFAREEQRRFEILEAHWDVPVAPTALVPLALTPTPARRP